MGWLKRLWRSERLWLAGDTTSDGDFIPVRHDEPLGQYWLSLAMHEGNQPLRLEQQRKESAMYDTTLFPQEVQDAIARVKAVILFNDFEPLGAQILKDRFEGDVAAFFTYNLYWPFGVCVFTWNPYAMPGKIPPQRKLSTSLRLNDSHRTQVENAGGFINA